MKKNNPYSIMFGKEPSQMVERVTQRDEILTAFTSDVPATQIFFITGVRGSGKTVLMSDVASRLSGEPGWLATEISPFGDMLTELASKLYNTAGMSKWFRSAEIDLSFFGIGVKLKTAEPFTNIEMAVRKILGQMKKEDKRLLVTVDEVVSSDDMRKFALAFQIFIREKLPIYLIMTGLYKNIDVLQNDKVLTFLLRAPRIALGSLNLRSIQRFYKETFRLEDDDALQMARLTGGYSYAFQVLGYQTFEQNGDFRKAVTPTQLYLEEYVYEKLWSELTGVEKNICKAIAESDDDSVLGVRKRADMKSNEFSPYREKLIKKGIINGSEYGHVSFTLPFFTEFVKTR